MSQEDLKENPFSQLGGVDSIRGGRSSILLVVQETFKEWERLLAILLECKEVPVRHHYPFQSRGIGRPVEEAGREGSYQTEKRNESMD